jgi:hypothetical protein
MPKIDEAHIAAAMLLAGGLLGWTRGPSAAEVRLEGQVQAGGGPIEILVTSETPRRTPLISSKITEAVQ